MTNLSRRIRAVEARLPPGPPTEADALRRRLTTTNEAPIFVSIFGNFSEYLEVFDFARRDDLTSALAVACRVNENFQGHAIGCGSKNAITIFRSIAFELVTEVQIIRLQELWKAERPLSEPETAEVRTIIFSAVARD